MNVVNHPKVAVLRLFVPSLVCLACLLGQPSPAQEQQNFQHPAAANPVHWEAGPIKADFGDVAGINVPDGYQFLDKNGAAFFLQGMHNPVPKNLLGILAPTSAKWFAVIEYSETGYVKDADAAKLDAAAMLGKIRGVLARQNIPSAATDWEIQPAYGAAQNELEWAIRVSPPGNPATVNYSVRLLGRRGVLEVIVAQPQVDFDPAPLREMVKGILFRDGERYSDYKSGDKVAKASLAQLALGETGQDQAANGMSWSRIILWVAVGLGVLLLAVGAGFAVKKLMRAGSRMDREEAVRPMMMRAAAASSGGSSITLAENQNQPSMRRAPERNGRSSKFHGRKRKKMYNFHLFYSDMVMNLTRWNYLGGFGSYASDYSHGLDNGTAPEQSSAENGNGAANNGNGVNGSHSNRTTANHNVSAGNGTPSQDALKAFALEASKLIENQQKLIEGQRKLIDEQNKLIQEKSKLIDFESNVLGKQSELIGDQGLL